MEVDRGPTWSGTLDAGLLKGAGRWSLVRWFGAGSLCLLDPMQSLVANPELSMLARWSFRKLEIAARLLAPNDEKPRRRSDRGPMLIFPPEKEAAIMRRRAVLVTARCRALN